MHYTLDFRDLVNELFWGTWDSIRNKIKTIEISITGLNNKIFCSYKTRKIFYYNSFFPANI